MPFPKVAGHPDYTRAGDSKFIPEIWSGKILVKLYDSVVFAAISNTDYEGEIKRMGDTVIIRTAPGITIRDYSMGANLLTERPTSNAITLSIDQGKYWNVVMDDVAKVQMDLNWLDKWTEEAAQSMKTTVDQANLLYMVNQAAAANRGATAGVRSLSYNLGVTGAAVQVTKADVLDYIVDCGSVLDEQNVPETGRWMVIPTWMAGLIKKSDLKDASLTGDSVTPMRNGKIGMIDRFTLYSSNLLPVAEVNRSYAYFGHKIGLTFASQLTETETLRAESTFGDIVRGLNVYGRKVVKSEAIGELYCFK